MLESQENAIQKYSHKSFRKYVHPSLEVLFNLWKNYSFISMPFSKILAEALLNIGVSGEYFVTKIAE